jgi:hypothetical protein
VPGSGQAPAYKFTFGLLCSTILAARLASVEARQDQAAATDVDGWS